MGKTVTVKFLNHVEKILQNISRNPKYIKKENIHRRVLIKQVTLYYRKIEQEIELITFWDTRQNPENLEF